MSNEEQILKYASIVYTSTDPDENALLIERSTKVLNDALIIKSGDSTTDIVGSNAAVKSQNYGTIRLIDSIINSSGYRADGALSNDDTGNLEIISTVITVTGEDTSGVYAYNGADINISDSEVNIKSDNSAALKATDSGTIYVNGGEYITEGNNSPVALERTKGRIIFGGNALLEAENSDTIVLDDDSILELGNSIITVTGDNTAIKSISGDNKITINGTTINGDQESTIIDVSDSSADISITNSKINYSGDHLLEVTNSTLTSLILQDQEISGGINVNDSTSELYIQMSNSTLTGSINQNKLMGTTTVNLENSVWSLTGNSYLSDLTVDSNSSILRNGYILTINGEPYTDGTDIGSVVHYTSPDGSIYERNCIVIKKEIDDAGDVILILYDADDHCAYTAKEENIKDTGKTVNIIPLLNEIEALLNGIDEYKSHTTIREKDPDTNAVIVDNRTVTLEDVTIIKSGDASSEEVGLTGRNAATLVTNSGTLNLSDSTITSNGDYAYGIDTIKNSTTTLDNVSITTNGDHSDGLRVESSTLTANDISVSVTGEHSDALRAINAIAISVENSSLSSEQGHGAHLINSRTFIKNTEITSNSENPIIVEELVNESSLYMDGVTINEPLSAQSSILYSGENGYKVQSTLINSTINNQNGPIITNSAVETTLNISNNTLNNTDSNNQIANVVNNGILTLYVSNQDLVGDFYVESGSTLNLFINGSEFTGKIITDDENSIVNVTLTNGAIWNVTADTYITSLNKDDSSTINIPENIFLYINGRYYVDPSEENDDYDNEEDKINVRILRVCKSEELPAFDDRDQNYIYFVYDKMRLYVGKYKFGDPFCIVEKLPEDQLPDEDQPTPDPEPDEGGDNEPTPDPDSGDNTNPDNENDPVVLGEGEDSGDDSSLADNLYPNEDNGSLVESIEDNSILVENMLYISIKQGKAYAYIDYQLKHVATIETKEQIEILKQAGTIYFMNAESRYLDFQTRRINLPYQNGTYQLSLSLANDLLIDKDTTVQYNPETNQFDLVGNHYIPKNRLKGIGNYTGIPTSTAITEIVDGIIKSHVRISSNENNGVEVRGNGIYVDATQFASQSDFSIVAYAFQQYRGIIDRYILQLRDAVQSVTGSVSQETINEKILEALETYKPTIDEMFNQYQYIYDSLDQLEYDSTTGVDEKVDMAKDEMKQYIDSYTYPWKPFEEDMPQPEPTPDPDPDDPTPSPDEGGDDEPTPDPDPGDNTNPDNENNDSSDGEDNSSTNSESENGESSNTTDPTEGEEP